MGISLVNALSEYINLEIRSGVRHDKFHGPGQLYPRLQSGALQDQIGSDQESRNPSWHTYNRAKKLIDNVDKILENKTG